MLDCSAFLALFHVSLVPSVPTFSSFLFSLSFSIQESIIEAFTSAYLFLSPPPPTPLIMPTHAGSIKFSPPTWSCGRWPIWGAHCRWLRPCNVAREKPRVRCGQRSTGTRPTAGTGTQLSNKRHKNVWILVSICHLKQERSYIVWNSSAVADSCLLTAQYTKLTLKPLSNRPIFWEMI